MNFLAHLYLSGNDEHLLTGNFIADAVKGSNFKGIEKKIARGIQLHRFIDGFTDNHPIVRNCTKRLQPVFHKYSPIVVDIFFDHYLATNWKDYHEEPLDRFAQKSYRTLKMFDDHLPEESRMILKYMSAGNWLFNYGSIDGIARAFTGMSRRTTFVSALERGPEILKQDYGYFEEEFRNFFPLIQFAVLKYLEENEPDSAL